MLVHYYILQGMYSDDTSSGMTDDNSSLILSSPEEVTQETMDRDSTLQTSPNVSCFINASTSDVDISEFSATSSAITSSGSDESGDFTTSDESSDELTLPTYRELIFYSPPEPEMPQPTEDITVPRNALRDIQLRVIPRVEISRNESIDQMARQMVYQEYPQVQEVVHINSPPEVIEMSDGSYQYSCEE